MNLAGISTRRHFLCSVAGAGAAIGLGGPRLPNRARAIAGEAHQGSFAQDATRLRRTKRESRAFGTLVSIEAWHADEHTAEAAVDAAFGELELVEQLMSIYRPDSQLSQLNRHGVLRKPHPYLVEVLRVSEAMSRRSAGAFDITVQPLWTLFAEAKKAGSLPTAASIERAQKAVGWRQVAVAADRIQLRGKETQITLNGIAQGFAADRAARALKRHGVAHALIDAGEIGTIGGRTEDDPWSVGIQHPRHADAYLSLAQLNGRCLATSGDYATAFSDDFRSNHLFDPRTGRSPNIFASVSVAATIAVTADALSTAVFVLGVEKGVALVESTAGADALLMLKDGRTLATRGFPRAT
jgi:FAD:protein FMN transferase